MILHTSPLAAIEPPDHWFDHAAAERFDDELRAEARAQIESDFELQSVLLSEHLTGADIRLLDNRAAFVRQCRDLLKVAIDDHVDTVVDRVHKSPRKYATIGEMVQRAIGGGL